METELMINDEHIIDRLTLSRAQHLKTHNNRLKSVSDDDIDGISDWSESDRECCPLSDFESTSNVDGVSGKNQYNIPFDDDDDDDDDEVDQRFSRETTFLENVLRLSETPLPSISDNNNSRRVSYSNDLQKSIQQQEQHYQQRSNNTVRKSSIYNDKQLSSPLLPGRRMPSKQVSPRRTTNPHVLSQTINISRNRKTGTPTPSRYCLQRETTSTSTNLNPHFINEVTLSPNSSFHSNDENQNHHRHVSSPNLSQTSMTNNIVPRVYELKKLHIEDYDYGRLTDVTTMKSIPPRNRQKWGTIVHPPFPLGYQQVTPEQVAQAVQRLSSPTRCRDRHTPIQTPTKRYLSVEETDALINRLTKVKPIRPPDQYWSAQRQSRPVKSFSNVLKSNHNWKGVGVSA